jgi:hypothetical protein
VSLAAPNGATRAATSAAARVALTDALKTAGLDATTYAPDSPTPGAAWPQWNITNWNGHIGDPIRLTFDIYAVINASDPETTIAAADDLVTRIPPAIERVAVVQSAEPVLITFGDQTTMPGVRFRVVTRH